MPAIDLSDILCLYYEEVNPTGAPPVLLLHGLGSRGESWIFQFDPLAEARYRVLAPDMRGFGRSSAPPEVTVQAMAEDMALFLERMGAVPAHVVGISMGGAVAQQLALDHPEMVCTLVLVSTFSHMRPQSLSGWLYFLTRWILINLIGPKGQAEMVAWRIFPQPDQELLRENLSRWIAQTNPCAYRSALRSLMRFDTRSRLSELRMPVLVVTGAEDTTVPPSVQHALARGIPGARHIVVEGSGHGIIADNPDTFNRILLKFLTEVRG
ncbi:alpha/beta fold hydrolase [Thermoflexus sp.]|uniref:alpha/beta fold hydrolase n=1 Tax=Thermoflexus sp. TaxID=1969742 RepID=UPI0035E400C4